MKRFVRNEENVPFCEHKPMYVWPPARHRWDLMGLITGGFLPREAGWELGCRSQRRWERCPQLEE